MVDTLLSFDKKVQSFQIGGRLYIIDEKNILSEVLLKNTENTSNKAILKKVYNSDKYFRIRLDAKVFQDLFTDDVFIITDKKLYRISLIDNHFSFELVLDNLPSSEFYKFVQFDKITQTIYIGTDNRGVLVCRPKYFTRILPNNTLLNTSTSAYAQVLLKNGNIQVNDGPIFGSSKMSAPIIFDKELGGYRLDKKDNGSIKIDGKDVAIKNPRDAIVHGFAFIPEDRRRQGLVMEHSVKQNILAANLSSLSHLNFLSYSKINSVVQDSIINFEVRPPEANREVRLLSGGNQQKVVIAKWMATNPKIVLMDEPTVGVDIGTKVEIMKLVRAIAAEGKSVILISSELPELLGVCDRILVIRKGKIAEELDRKDVKDEDHLQMIVQGIKV
jgi:ABC-type cobalamin/Fe3+-siderophores transport system ATPase subunit